MHLKLKNKDKMLLINFFEWIIYMLGYTLVFMIVTSFFETFYIDGNSFIYSVIIVLITYILNKTVKPILVSLTIPITAMSLGLFYPVINLLILKIADLLLGNHFQIKNIFIAFFVAILLSVMNLIMEHIVKKIIRGIKNNG